MLYKLSLYRSIRNKFDPVIKMVKVNPGSSFESIFIHACSPGAGADNPLGTKF